MRSLVPDMFGLRCPLDVQRELSVSNLPRPACSSRAVWAGDTNSGVTGTGMAVRHRLGELTSGGDREERREGT